MIPTPTVSRYSETPYGRSLGTRPRPATAALADSTVSSGHGSRIAFGVAKLSATNRDTPTLASRIAVAAIGSGTVVGVTVVGADDVDGADDVGATVVAGGPTVVGAGVVGRCVVAAPPLPVAVVVVVGVARDATPPAIADRAAIVERDRHCGGDRGPLMRRCSRR